MKEFQFVDDGHTFFCNVEVPRQQGMSAWWWFRRDSDGSTRYAPFEAAPGDTQQSVRARILSYYADLQAIKARPAYQRPAWRKPAAPAADTPAPATAAIPVIPT